MTGGIIRAPESNSEISKIVLQRCGKIICYYYYLGQGTSQIREQMSGSEIS